jgi:hypothetical protein
VLLPVVGTQMLCYCNVTCNIFYYVLHGCVTKALSCCSEAVSEVSEEDDVLFPPFRRGAATLGDFLSAATVLGSAQRPGRRSAFAPGGGGLGSRFSPRSEGASLGPGRLHRPMGPRVERVSSAALLAAPVSPDLAAARPARPGSGAIVRRSSSPLPQREGGDAAGRVPSVPLPPVCDGPEDGPLLQPFVDGVCPGLEVA